LYSLRVEEDWKLGRKNSNDGVLFVVALTDRSMRIEVGYGLEGALNDAISKRIISEIIIPYFKQGQIYEGINKGVSQIINSIQGEPLPYSSKSSHSKYDEDAAILVALVLFAIFTNFFFIRNITSSPKTNKVFDIIFTFIVVVVGLFLANSIFFVLCSGVIVYILNKLPFEISDSTLGNGRSTGSSSDDNFSGGGGSSGGGGGASGQW